jgi:hypothetical protein
VETVVRTLRVAERGIPGEIRGTTPQCLAVLAKVSYMSEKRPTKETHKRDPQKRPTVSCRAGQGIVPVYSGFTE